MIGRVYKLEGGGKFYIGSTTCSLKNRLKHHRSKSSESISKNRQLYVHFRELGWENVNIILLEEFEISSRKDLLQRECEILKENINIETCLNRNLPIITPEEKKQRDRIGGKARREIDPERERLRLQEWRKNNPEKWKAQYTRYNQRKKEKDISVT
jgi:hypothetical protein